MFWCCQYVHFLFLQELLILRAEYQTEDYLRLVAEVSAEFTNILENSHVMFSTVIPELGG